MSNDAPPRYEGVFDQPSNESAVRAVRWQCSYADNPYHKPFSTTPWVGAGAEVGTWAEWQRQKPDDFTGRTGQTTDKLPVLALL